MQTTRVINTTLTRGPELMVYQLLLLQPLANIFFFNFSNTRIIRRNAFSTDLIDGCPLAPILVKYPNAEYCPVAKNGQAKVLSNDELQSVLDEIENHRYPEKNAVIIQISFKLGLRAQEMSLLRIREVATLGAQYASGYQIKDVLVLPKSFTKGARAVAANGNKENSRTSVRFTIAEFDRLVAKISRDSRAGKSLEASEYYPEQKKPGGLTRELPLADTSLLDAIKRYLDVRMADQKHLKPNDPLLLSQKGGFYSPNTLQDHVATMLREWSGIERSSSHSGRRTLATKLIHDEGEHLKTVQKILGHKSAATTTIYQDVTEEQVEKVLKNVGNSYRK